MRPLPKFAESASRAVSLGDVQARQLKLTAETVGHTKRLAFLLAGDARPEWSSVDWVSSAAFKVKPELLRGKLVSDGNGMISNADPKLHTLIVEAVSRMDAAQMKARGSSLAAMRERPMTLFTDKLDRGELGPTLTGEVVADLAFGDEPKVYKTKQSAQRELRALAQAMIFGADKLARIGWIDKDDTRHDAYVAIDSTRGELRIVSTGAMEG
jgi:hypothetical protein